MKTHRVSAHLVLTGLLAVVPTTAYAEEGKARLREFVDELVTMQAGFEQTLTDETGKHIETSEGKVFIQRPNKFRWDYQTLYEQSIVADGQKVWFYDKDLAQVTVKSMNAALGSTPAVLLGSNNAIDEEFTVTDLGTRDGIAWVELLPKDQENQFTTVRLGFDQSTLKEMELLDNFGQSTYIRFNKAERNITLNPELFKFEPPPGVDLIDSTGSQ
ncbi:MAG: outer membrane lipoprotein chaperone LolA [Gammaproteobacteria bacterium]|nr:outer membrane lipoprotein chaperone LolA [Gammaproteobacteria bacterium]MCI0590714.1 outer membrane lipoprotein chaperone LolA [Gammaproteobacteria bacterium]